MPIHDWTRVDAGLFHDFHQDWTVELCRALNGGRLPPGFTALIDLQTSSLIPDVITLHGLSRYPEKREPGSLAVANTPPRARFVDEIEEDTYARRLCRRGWVQDSNRAFFLPSLERGFGMNRDPSIPPANLAPHRLPG